MLVVTRAHREGGREGGRERERGRGREKKRERERETGETDWLVYLRDHDVEPVGIHM